MTKILRYIAITSLVLGISIIIYTTEKFGIINNLSNKGFSDLGQYGGFIGGVVGPLFSLSAALFIYISLVEARKVSFEATFFSMLNLHNELVAEITCYDGSQTLKGRACFKHFYTLFKDYYIKRIFQPESNNQHKTGKDSIVGAFSDLYANQDVNLSHYFRFLYHIIKTIDKSPISFKRKKNYTNIVRSILSTNEQLLLFYNGIWYSEAKFYPLIIKYELLENMPKSKLINNANNQKLPLDYYPKKAFGNPD